jgi:hypothetical protein
LRCAPLINARTPCMAMVRQSASLPYSTPHPPSLSPHPHPHLCPPPRLACPQVLVDDVNTGYQQFQSLQVLRVNGTEVLNLEHLKELVEGASGAQGTEGAEGDGSSEGKGEAEGNGEAEGKGRGMGTDRFVWFELEDERIMVVDR